jgi:hypothetical protein
MVEIYSCPRCGNATTLRSCLGTLHRPHSDEAVSTRPTVAIPVPDVALAVADLCDKDGDELTSALEALVDRVRTVAGAHHYPIGRWAP